MKIAMEAAGLKVCTITCTCNILFMQRELFTTKKDLVDALAAVEEGKSLEPKLRQTIVELDDERRELMVLPAFCVHLTLLLALWGCACNLNFNGKELIHVLAASTIQLCMLYLY